MNLTRHSRNQNMQTSVHHEVHEEHEGKKSCGSLHSFVPFVFFVVNCPNHYHNAIDLIRKKLSAAVRRGSWRCM